MILKYCFYVLVMMSIVSCSKDSTQSDESYFVSAERMIAITTGDWSTVEPLLSGKRGYQYTAASASQASIIRGTVALPAIDDSNRIATGEIKLNISPGNMALGFFVTEPITKELAYAMMLDYNNASVQSLSGITFSIGGFVDSVGNGGNCSVPQLISKLTNGEAAKQLDINYKVGLRQFTMAVFRQADGRYKFDYRGL